MTENHRVLLSLIGSALGNSNVDFKCFRIHWEDLYVLALEQGVQGIVFDSLEKLQYDMRPPKDLLLPFVHSLFNSFDSMEMISSFVILINE